jgi:hypothetical protein
MKTPMIGRIAQRRREGVLAKCHDDPTIAIMEP